LSAIICAIRGGSKSQATIQKAIKVAKETKLPVFFLYVIDVDFLVHTSLSRVHPISEELQEMGEFILLMARDKAEAQGVESMHFVRHGDVREEILRLCRECDGRTIVLGRPRLSKERSVFSVDRLELFKKQISQECDAELLIASEEDA
jgi:nucleotide-binding universal stress UspA family protein